MPEASPAIDQETMLRAWRGSDSYEPRAQLTTWLHAIATNVCLTAITRRGARPAEPTDELEHLQPYPDRLLEDLVVRETVELAFIIAIQLLSPKQRAVLTLRDVLGWSAKEAAEVLDDSVAAVTSALQRARAGVEKRRILGCSNDAGYRLSRHKRFRHPPLPRRPATARPERRRRRGRAAVTGVVAGLRARGAELVGELERYEDRHRLCYVRGPERARPRSGPRELAEPLVTCAAGSAGTRSRGS